MKVEPLSDEDLTRMKTQISKSLSNQSIQATISLLETLMTWKATAETLKSSGIGLFVTDIRKNEEATAEIKQKSKEIIVKWKLDIRKPQADSKRSHAEHNIERKGSVAHSDTGVSASSLVSSADSERNAIRGLLFYLL